MNSVIESKDIVSSFENSVGQKVSITQSMLIYTVGDDAIAQENLIYPINRIDSYNILKYRNLHYWLFSILAIILWFWLYSKETSCTFMSFGCTTESTYLQGILNGWWLLLLSAIGFYMGFIKHIKLTISSVSNGVIELKLTENNEEDRAKEFLTELNKIYSRSL